MKAIAVDNHEIIVTGKLLKRARIKEEWDDDIEDPASLISKLMGSAIRIDILTFMQRVPDSKPKYDYCMEWDSVAAIPISSYEYWLENQLHPNHRNKIRIAKKKGVVVKLEEFSDEMVRRIKEIYDETQVRQGYVFRDYKKEYGTFKGELSTYLDRADFLGAYYNDELIGYIKLVYTGKFARTMGILSKIAHREKAATNILIAEAVKLCSEKRVPFLVYGKFTYGFGKLGSQSLMDFKRYNGFESIVLPRYYIPLTTLGKLLIRVNLHHGFVGVVPQKMIHIYRELRTKYYTKRYG